MKKSLITLFALAFTLMFGLVHVASAEKHMAPAAKSEAKMDKKADKALAKACKGKKAGDVVTVNGKEMQCPEKKMNKKAAPKPAKEGKPATPAAPAK
ncbi:MAG TPA: hypothetical protein VFU39_04020 [Sulfuricaulis sp.]|nr:hypothetical protein [Sulfuricaulis sp.]